MLKEIKNWYEPPTKMTNPVVQKLPYIHKNKIAKMAITKIASVKPTRIVTKAAVTCIIQKFIRMSKQKIATLNPIKYYIMNFS